MSNQFFYGAGFSATLFAFALFLARNLIVERLRISLQKELEQFKQTLIWEKKIKEEAAKVAEYLALARDLHEDDDRKKYSYANQLSWELAMWLPENIYKAAVKSIVNRDPITNELSTVISVRKLLLKQEAGNLNQSDIAVHGPGIGKM